MIFCLERPNQEFLDTLIGGLSCRVLFKHIDCSSKQHDFIAEEPKISRERIHSTAAHYLFERIRQIPSWGTTCFIDSVGMGTRSRIWERFKNNAVGAWKDVCWQARQVKFVSPYKAPSTTYLSTPLWWALTKSLKPLPYLFVYLFPS